MPPKPAEQTVVAPTADVEALARTLLVEHEAAASSRTGVAAGTRPTDGTAAIVVPEPYDDRGEIGRGGMGSVHSAFDHDLQRVVAIKAMLPELSGEAALAQGFVNEARITALIDHPHIAPVHRLERGPDGSLLLVMKLIDGCTLTEHLCRLPAPPWEPQVLDDLLSLFVKICDAVAYAHSRGVVHLDLKPDNVMVGPFGQVYVVDWGIARFRQPEDQPAVLSGLEQQRVSTGTLSYMSPEQALIDEERIGPLSDVYLLGGILYQVLTTRPPHDGSTVLEVLGSAIRGEVVPPDRSAPDRPVPPALAMIAMKALSAQPGDRHQSVLDLQRDVLAFQRGEERAPRRTYAHGTVVFRAGDTGDEAFVVVSGRCEVTVDDNGRRTVLRELGPGDVFGETAVFSDRPRTATVEAVDDLVVRVVSREMLGQSLGMSTWAGAFIRTLADRFREADLRSRHPEGPGPGGRAASSPPS